MYRNLCDGNQSICYIKINHQRAYYVQRLLRVAPDATTILNWWTQTSKMEARVIHDIKHFLQMMIALYFCMYHDFNQLSMLKIMHKQTTNFFSCLYLFLINTQVTAIKSCHWFLINRLISRDMRVQTRHPLYQFMQPVHLLLHGFCLGSVAGEVAPKIYEKG